MRRAQDNDEARRVNRGPSERTYQGYGQDGCLLDPSSHRGYRIFALKSPPLLGNAGLDMQTVCPELEELPPWHPVTCQPLIPPSRPN